MNPEIAVAVIAAAAALLTSLAALYRSGVDSRKVTSDAATSSVVAASELIDDLRCEIQRLRERIGDLEKKTASQAEEILRLQLEVSQARERITALETENEILREENHRLGGGDCE